MAYKFNYRLIEKTPEILYASPHTQAAATAELYGFASKE
jgi:hypothetical protein